MRDITIEVASDLDQLQRLAPGWHRLSSAGATPFQTFAWNLSWWRLIGSRQPEHRLLTLAIRRNGRLVALAPFMVDRDTLRFVGAPWADYADVVVAESDADRSAAVDGLWWWLTGHRGSGFGRLELDEIPPWSALWERPLPQWALAEDASVCPSQQLVHPVRVSSNVQRKANVLLRSGELSLHVRTGRTELRAALPEFMSMHLRQWYGRPDCGLTFSRPDLLLFYSQSSDELSAAGLIALLELRVGDRPAAFDYGYLYQDTFWSWRPTFEPALAAGSPGAVLHGLAVARLAADGYARYDFMRGEFDYKSRYTDDAVRNRRIKDAPTV